VVQLIWTSLENCKGQCPEEVQGSYCSH
jgi:hypothetical protein